jgi:hypothetical protein
MAHSVTRMMQKMVISIIEFLLFLCSTSYTRFVLSTSSALYYAKNVLSEGIGNYLKFLIFPDSIDLESG